MKVILKEIPVLGAVILGDDDTQSGWAVTKKSGKGAILTPEGNEPCKIEEGRTYRIVYVKYIGYTDLTAIPDNHLYTVEKIVEK